MKFGRSQTPSLKSAKSKVSLSLKTYTFHGMSSMLIKSEAIVILEAILFYYTVLFDETSRGRKKNILYS